MFITLLHPGDLGLVDWLSILSVLLGVPALVIGILAFAIYKGLSEKKGSFTTINLEGNFESDNSGRDWTHRA